MWSLPDIKQMNAAALDNRGNFVKQTKLGRSVKHRCCCGAPSTHHQPYFDIFSNDIKGVIHSCSRCRHTGNDMEGFFTCGCCDRIMIDHITWERYAVEMDGDVICTACAAKNYFADDDNLIDPNEVVSIINEEGDPLFKDGALNLEGTRHVLAVKQPVPEGIEFIENFENANDAGRFDESDMMRCIKELGDRKFFIVLDAAYQWSVSIGIYCRKIA